MTDPVKRIFIVGHSGAGKAILAHTLAKKLNWQFIDADFSLTPTIGRSLSEVLSVDGEKSFQHCLSAILIHQISKENVVITTDDSIILNAENRQKLSEQFTVYADVSVSVQFNRISQNRPLLPVDDYQAFLEKLHKERDSLYEEVASLEILTDDGDLDGHVSRIIEAIEK
ncbi:shikimate kinase [Candidatus Berkiella aquae]|uniref:Shikimate kinase n=1 Tax=Candidatus Berkiella aquae TaxID=295108 RepID=A0A0Q9YV77_9GAMM|nr:shikimate kinase [Candidatus Berkiella aquae]MCS5711547.1 hypothetical protein [Candidatus Berkiella aquae]